MLEVALAERRRADMSIRRALLAAVALDLRLRLEALALILRMAARA